jgi:predicted alpha/beta superfamily hydrolase
VLEKLESPQLGNRRDIYVYLPRSYGESERRFPVLYMQDGQNLFDRATSYAEEWGVDQILEASEPGRAEAIIVGIPNTGDTRCDEYSPFRDPKLGGGDGDRYLDFLTDTVMPLVDARFRTMPGRATTGIAGSSMGGLISLYAFFRRSDSFGFAGVLSPAMWFAGGAIFGTVRSAPFVPGRIHLDCGTHEGRVAAADVRRMRDLLVDKGYREDIDLRYFLDRGGRHNEVAWGRRFRDVIEFLLPESSV